MIRPFIVACIWVAAVLAGVLALLFHAWWTLPAAVLAGLAALGAWDLIQTRHTILRLYPILGHVRFLMELIRPDPAVLRRIQHRGVTVRPRDP